MDNDNSASSFPENIPAMLTYRPFLLQDIDEFITVPFAPKPDIFRPTPFLQLFRDFAARKQVSQKFNMSQAPSHPVHLRSL